jgi:hypothetical protein
MYPQSLWQTKRKAERNLLAFKWRGLPHIAPVAFKFLERGLSRVGCQNQVSLTQYGEKAETRRRMF